MPAIPASLIASKSAVMPGFATLPPIRKTYVSGLFATDGLRNSPSGAPRGAGPHINALSGESGPSANAVDTANVRTQATSAAVFSVFIH